jgi:biopolymer transport protein ExbB
MTRTKLDRSPAAGAGALLWRTVGRRLGLLAALSALLAVGLTFDAAAGAPEESPDEPEPASEPSEEAPLPADQDAALPASDPALAELARAIFKARKDLEAAEEQYSKETRDQQARIAEETKAIIALREEEKLLWEKTRSLGQETRALEEKAASLAASRAAAESTLDAVRKEIARQAESLIERLKGNLVTAQDEQLLQAAGELQTNPHIEAGKQFAALSELYQRVLRYAGSVAVFSLDLRVPDAADRVEKLRVLRLGLLGGYFSKAAVDAGGFVLGSPDREGFAAESRGLSARQQSMIVTLLQKPEKGGSLPFDVTGGAAIAVQAHAGLGFAEWFRRGGIWMWALAGIALLGLLLGIERGIVMALGVFGIDKRVRRIAGLVNAGKLAAAMNESAKAKDALGAVLHAAIANRERGRDAVDSAVAEALSRGAHGLHSRLGLFSIAVAAAPLLGFLGTVSILFSSLKLMSVPEFDSSWSLIAVLPDALIPTQAGLAVAILCILARGALAAIAGRGLEKLELAGHAIVVALIRIDEEEASEAELNVGGAV